MILSAGYKLRQAALSDRDEIQALIVRSARELSSGDYTPEQIEGALRGVFGVDTQLIQDGTYFVVETHGKIVGCGGWSKRGTLFGGDTHDHRNDVELNPSTDAARIRAFFVDPLHARKGLGSMILDRCEADARAHGFSRFSLMATLPGVRLYAARGYVAEDRVLYNLAPTLTMELVPMHKPGTRLL